MAYTVLARKYRSRTFSDVVGQEPIATTLVNAIKAGRIHHGYLFTGTRGVGKTSMARILAKALNCRAYDAPTPTPCGDCELCRAVAEGEDIDVLEIDAASNTGVDNIRELRSNATLRPARGRFKIYIIDEVHMLSTGAFNALLKTLEEPPDHVKFILATTEIHKVPATIRSRCQCFSFRNITAEDIARRLAEIVQAEGREAEEAVLQRVARLGAGSMRDALSILDQLLAFTTGRLTEAVLDELLPPTQDERIVTLLGHAARGEAAAVLLELDGLLGAGRGLDSFVSDLVETVRMLMLVRTCGPDAPLVDIPAGRRDEYLSLAQAFELSHYVQMIGMLEELRRHVRSSGAGRALTEAVLVRFARLREWAAIEQLLAQLAPDDGGSEKKKLGPEPLETIDAAQPPAARGTRGPAGVTADADAAPPGRSPARGEPERTAAPAGSPPLRAAPSPAAARPVAGPPPRAAPLEAAEPGPLVALRSPGGASDPGGVRGTLELRATPGDGDAWRGAVPAAGLAGEVRRRVEEDPVVRQALELFDGLIVDVRTAPPPADR